MTALGLFEATKPGLQKFGSRSVAFLALTRFFMLCRVGAFFLGVSKVMRRRQWFAEWSSNVFLWLTDWEWSDKQAIYFFSAPSNQGKNVSHRIMRSPALNNWAPAFCSASVSNVLNPPSGPMKIWV